MMDFNEYMSRAAETAIYKEKDAIIYPALELGNEAGEVLGKIKKVLRDNDGVFSTEKKEEIVAELGDVMWAIAALCRDLGTTMGYVANMNLEKLRKRKENGTIGGSGDNR